MGLVVLLGLVVLFKEEVHELCPFPHAHAEERPW